jgi:heavy metal translocating P-type ATPase
VRKLLLIVTLAGIAAGSLAWLLGAARPAAVVWALTTVAALLPLTWSVCRSLGRGEIGVDVIALLAMVGSLVFGQYLAGAVIALMLSGGQALEGFADSRARRELSALLARAPGTAHRYENGALTSPPLAAIRPGDLLLVKPGEVVAVDGMVAEAVAAETGCAAGAVLDESALTGESRPVERALGEPVHSGTVNMGGPFAMRAVAAAAASTYAGIVRMVEAAQAAKAPFVRLADRYALVFLPVTLVVAALAWLLSGDPVRALAVLVVATPCPLILAAPVALMAGVSSCARRGVIVKGGRALEALARGRVLLLDKTGTLTTGMPELGEVEVFGGIGGIGGIGGDEMLRLAASLDQVSPHVLASALVRAARGRGLPLSLPGGVGERVGQGIAGTVDGRQVAVGKLDWVAGPGPLPAAVRQVRRRVALEGSSNVFVAVDGRLAGALVLHDPMRPDGASTVQALRRSGIERVVLVTGDLLEVAETVGAGIGADATLAQRSPQEKVAAVLAERRRGPTVMVGDGVNDAPALAAADVGVAMGARGATASSEAADVVITVDRLDRLADALRIARRSRRIALQSVLAGMGLSLAAMLVAGAGYLPPVAGALLQEGIDAAVIFNALRALLDRGRPRGGPPAARAGTAIAVRAEHQALLPQLDRLRSLADRLEDLPGAEAQLELQGVRRFLEDRLVPHEQREDTTLYPLVARAIGGHDPTAPMSRAHLEIGHLARLYGRLLDELPGNGAGPPPPIPHEDVRDLRRVLYGLHAILRLHFAQEEEQYLPLLER